MAQLVSAGETTLYFQKENFPQLSAGLSVNCDIVAPIMIVPPSNMQSSYFLIEKLCAWVCLEGCLGIELCLGVCQRGFLNTDCANRVNPHLDYPQLEYPQLDYPQLDYPQLDYPNWTWTTPNWTTLNWTTPIWTEPNWTTPNWDGSNL